MVRFLSNLHTHSVFSDGANTMEEIVLQAIANGFVSIGFSDHSHTDNLAEYCMKKGSIQGYLKEIDCLKDKYGDRIEIYRGIEWDSDTYLPEYDGVSFDYVIGSVHYFKTANGNFYDVDYHPDILRGAMIQNSLSAQDLVKIYFDLVGEMTASLKPDIIGHLDLITKFNRQMNLFDESSGWYLDIVGDILGEIRNAGSIVEVNTGAIARGLKDKPYPSEYILKEMVIHEIPVTISSDSHHIDTLDCYFDESLEILKNIGYKSVKILKNGKFQNMNII